MPPFYSYNRGYSTDSVVLTMISQKTAKSYHDAGNTLTYKKGSSSDQLGPGAYISPILGDWPTSDAYWDCAIFADTLPWDLVNKAWVPATAEDGCTPLWWANGGRSFLKHISSRFKYPPCMY